MNNDDREWHRMIAVLKVAMDDDRLLELDHDLWPRMQARLAAPRPSVSWVDLVLLAAIVVFAVAFPEVMLGMLYHL